MHEFAVGTYDVKVSADIENYDELTDNFKFECGEFKAYIGSSLSDIRLQECFKL